MTTLSGNFHPSSRSKDECLTNTQLVFFFSITITIFKDEG